MKWLILAALLGGGALAATSTPVKPATPAKPSAPDPLVVPLDQAAMALQDEFFRVLEPKLRAAMKDDRHLDGALSALRDWDNRIRRADRTKLLTSERAAAWAEGAAGVVNAVDRLSRQCVAGHDLKVLERVYRYALLAFTDPSFKGYFKADTQARLKREAEACGSFELQMSSAIDEIYPNRNPSLDTDHNTWTRIEAKVPFILPLLPAQGQTRLGSAPANFARYDTTFLSGCARSVKLDVGQMEVLNFQVPDLLVPLTEESRFTNWALTIRIPDAEAAVKGRCPDGAEGEGSEEVWAPFFSRLHIKDLELTDLLDNNPSGDQFNHVFTLSDWKRGSGNVLLEARYRRSDPTVSTNLWSTVNEDTVFRIVHRVPDLTGN